MEEIERNRNPQRKQENQEKSASCEHLARLWTLKGRKCGDGKRMLHGKIQLHSRD